MTLTIKHPSVYHSEPSGDDLYHFGLLLPFINSFGDSFFSESPVIFRAWLSKGAFRVKSCIDSLWFRFVKGVEMEAMS